MEKTSYHAEGCQACGYMDSLIGKLTLEYGFAVRKIVPAKRGFFGETWKIETEAAEYFVCREPAPAFWCVQCQSGRFSYHPR